MKTILISLLLAISFNAKAEQIENNHEIRYDGAGAPIFANLSLAGVTRNMTLINPRFKQVTGGNLTFNNKKLSLVINRSMPRCAEGMMCIQVMPAPLKVELEVVKIERSRCSIVYTAQTPKNVKSEVSEQVIVEDFTYSKCPTLLAQPAGRVTYSVTGLSNLTKQTETATATLNVDGEFVRAVN